MACDKTKEPYIGTTRRVYIGTTGRGAEQDTLLTCGNRMAEDKAEIPIADSESGVRRSRAQQSGTLAIGEANPGGV